MRDIRKLVLASMFAALTCVSTLIIRIPTPGTGGYVHPGDAIVILSGIFLGPAYGACAAGIGSALADLLGGYLIYAPISLIIKAFIALATGYISRQIRKGGKHLMLCAVCGGIIDVLFVSIGYLIYEILLYGWPGAVASLFPNVLQGISGLVISLILYPVLASVPELRRSEHIPANQHRNSENMH